MIRLGVRFALAGDREAVGRLALIAVGVAVGVGLLLATIASLHAINAQNSRYAWLETGFSGSDAPAGSGQATSAAAPPAPSVASASASASAPASASASATADGGTASDRLWWRLRADEYEGREIGRVDVAATGPHSPVPPGIARLPKAGEFYASPALARLLARTPRAELGDRFPGVLVGTIGSAALPAPNSLIIVIGHAAAELAPQSDVGQVSAISTTTPASCADGCAFGVGISADALTLILSVVAAALLFPIMIFVGNATRLSAARREQRFAAMRLVGATPGQISVISAVESGMAALTGAVGGFGVFYAARPALAGIPFTGQPFFTGDLMLGVRDVVLVAVGIPVVAVVAARVALRRVNVSPLGISRRVTPRPPRAWRVLPLAAGLGELAYAAYVADIGARSSTSTSVEAAVFLSGVLLTMMGLLAAGPWLTMLCSRSIAGHARRAATLVAARRIADNPQAAFRSVAGLVLALFVSTCAVGIITTIAAYNDDAVGSAAPGSATILQVLDDDPAGPRTPTGSTMPADVRQRLASIPGVAGIALTRRVPGVGSGQHGSSIVVSCAELASVPALGRCPSGAGHVTMNPDFGGGIVAGTSPLSATVWPRFGGSDAELARSSLSLIAVATSGSSASVERVRTTLGLAYPRTYPPLTLTEFRAHGSWRLKGYRRLANVAIFASVPIAGCALALSVAGGLADRRRPFSLLRLAGTPVGVLRRVIVLEAVVPLLATAAAAIGTGLLVAQLFLRGQLYETLHFPGAGYYLVLLAGLAIALAVISSAMPVLARTTGPEAARQE
jgi:hypothetical protein